MNINIIVRIILLVIGVIFVLALLGLSFTIFSSWIKTKYFFVEKKSLRLKNKKVLKKRLYAEIDKHMYAYTVEVIFLMFCYFYEQNYEDIHNNWQFEENAFPNGAKDLDTIYEWITEERLNSVENLKNCNIGSLEELKEINRMFDLDTEKAGWILERRKYLML